MKFLKDFFDDCFDPVILIIIVPFLITSILVLILDYFF